MTAIAALYRDLLARWRGRMPVDLMEGREGVVLAGAGVVGRQFRGALRDAGIEVLAFADNRRGAWGTSVQDVTVMAPQEAVARYGRSAVFIVTIGRLGPAAADVLKQFSALGAERVMHFPEAIRLIPGIWPQFFANPSAFTEADTDRCVAAYELFQDEESRQHFVSHLRWRMTLDPAPLATPDYDDQYFPDGVIAPRHCAVFVDVGAYTGDTLVALDAFGGERWREYYGFEPDPINYAALASEAAAMTAARPQTRIVTRLTAIGAAEGEIAFSGGGAATSQVDPAGQVRVPCATLDSVGIGRPSYVKVDVEGAEQDVLRGAAGTLAGSRPTVAIATYHHPTDLFDLPLALAAFASDYRFHLRSHGDAGIDLVCYAVRDPEPVVR